MVRGLPPEIIINQSSEDQVKFHIGDIEYAIHKSKKIVTLEDMDVNRVRFDLAIQQIRSGEIDVIQQNTPEGRVFSIPLWKMGGKIQETDGHVIIEVACDKLASPFSVVL